MTLSFRMLFLAITAFLFANATTLAFADAKSDYDYQLGKYRQSYGEYMVIKNDYLSNQTLDNQQKAMLAAKQSIQNRDLAKAAFAQYLSEMILEKKAPYEPVAPVLVRLEEAKNFYLTSAQKGKEVITPADLKVFTEDYVLTTDRHDKALKYGIVSNKLVQMVRFQLENDNALNIIRPKLPASQSVPLKGRIEELTALGVQINTLIDKFSTKILPEDEDELLTGATYFSEKIELLNNIRTLQVNWIDKLIDVDINYVQPKN